MKPIVIERPTRDVNGLMRLLQAQDPPFAVMSVGADSRRTYLYLDDDETRDPAPIVQEWKDAPELQVSVAGTPGHLGVVEVAANGIDVHVLTIRKTTPTGEVIPGNERINVSTRSAVKISDARPRLVDGVTVVEVGPYERPGEARIDVTDSSGKMSGASVTLRFTRKKPEPPPEPVVEESPVDPEAVEMTSDPEAQGGIWSTLKRILRI